MKPTQAVGIDLGTTYSCIAYLNEHGEPVTLPNQEGELFTPSVVLFEGDDPIVGTEGLRNAILHPNRVVQNAKRHMGDAGHRWMIGGKPFTAVDISALIVKKLVSGAQEQIGPITHAVITVPAQFSDAARHATIQAGHRAGLERIDLINEPVAAALCHVLGTEGIWFTELARDQRILVYDLGGGTLDLSLVRYRKNEVSVIASSGDLYLGGIDWNRALQENVCRRFAREFDGDPRDDPVSLQFLALEVEQAKRSLSVRPRAALACQHAGNRRTYQIQQSQFEKLTRPLVERTAKITERLVKDSGRGWSQVDVVLTTGGASRMPMIRAKLKEMSGRTLNTSLSPDLSIAHGATYYAGMLLSNDKFARSILNEQASRRLSGVKQKSVNARGLGILVRDVKTNRRIPHYMIRANTPLPASATQNFGTVVPNQRRVRLHIVESGTSPDKPPAMLGRCVIDSLPPRLPEGSEVAVTIRYDAQARVHVSARDVASGKQAATEIIRQENLLHQLESDRGEPSDVSAIAQESDPRETYRRPQSVRKSIGLQPPPARPAPKAASTRTVANSERLTDGKSDAMLEISERPIPLCNDCGEPLNARGDCPNCGNSAKQPPQAAAAAQRARAQSDRHRERSRDSGKKAGKASSQRRRSSSAAAASKTQTTPLPGDDNVIDLVEDAFLDDVPVSARRRKRAGNKAFLGRKVERRKRPSPTQQPGDESPSDLIDLGEEEFWKLAD